MTNVKEKDLRERDNREIRDKFLENDFQYKDMVKDLILCGTTYTTTSILADAFGVDEKSIRKTVVAHKGEFAEDYVVTKKCSEFVPDVEQFTTHIEVAQGGRDLYFRDGRVIHVSNNTIKLFPRKAILRLAMLLEDSKIAYMIRCQITGEEVDFAKVPNLVPYENNGVISVKIKKGDLLTMSCNVADIYNKDHAKVLRDIKKIIKDLTKLNDEEGEAKNGLAPIDRFYREVSYRDAQGKERPAYEITFDGFMLLAMGYTGQKALVHKIAYMDEFNRMREKLECLQHKRDEANNNAVIVETGEIVNVDNGRSISQIRTQNKLLSRMYVESNDKNMVLKETLVDSRSALESEREKCKVLQEHVCVLKAENERLKKEIKLVESNNNVIQIETHTGKIFDWVNANGCNSALNCVQRLSNITGTDIEDIWSLLRYQMRCKYKIDIVERRHANKRLVKPTDEKKFEKAVKRVCKDFDVRVEDLLQAA